MKMSSLTRKLHGREEKEIPFELKYNCLRHLNDELLRRLAEADVFRLTKCFRSQ
jgi:hypothetical protein